MKKALTVSVIISLSLVLAGCNSNRDGISDSGWRSENIATPSGSVTCVLFDGYDGEAISCDWDAKKALP